MSTRAKATIETMDDGEVLWTFRDVARFLKVSVRMVYSLPEIPRIRVGSRVRFVPHEVRRWAGSQKVS